VRIVKSSGGGIFSPSVEYLTVGATAVTEGQALTVVAGVLVTAYAAGAQHALRYISLKAGAISATLHPVEEVRDDSIIEAAYSGGTPTVGAQYGVTSDGLGLLVTDTTYIKLEVISVDTVRGVALCRGVTRAVLA
jgi:hypothetical protein